SLHGIPIYVRQKSDHGRVVCWVQACIVLHNFLCDYEDDTLWRLRNCNLKKQQEGLELDDNTINKQLELQSE
ncbi:hypothetical protein C7212DRAFT_204829, partial [Tuber magnatum]